MSALYTQSHALGDFSYFVSYRVGPVWPTFLFFLLPSVTIIILCHSYVRCTPMWFFLVFFIFNTRWRIFLNFIHNLNCFILFPMYYYYLDSYNFYVTIRYVISYTYNYRETQQVINIFFREHFVFYLKQTFFRLWRNNIIITIQRFKNLNVSLFIFTRKLILILRLLFVKYDLINLWFYSLLVHYSNDYSIGQIWEHPSKTLTR